ncbi:MAG TPA: four helix bundle protein [Ignavibacteriaceae bacterium]|nr:four helix bundle protein [Ignavibacteriaceae bacterium]
MKAITFEDLNVWKVSREFVKSIYELTCSDKFSKDFGLRDQIRRSAVSIMNNIAEGFERNNNREFIKFLKYSKGSAGEVRSMLYVALDLNYISGDSFQSNYEKSINIITQISNFIKYLRKHAIKENLSKLRSLILQFLNF